ncbi:MAG: redoxin domain-containing protein, partial [Candidatus Thiodiazotropha sp. (ex Gloverina cf. vestifex)]|nr:redoxin domain-containing protein [Candidatus Thiodiazotropha sp. (ex Gloverina cf. vestifex)]
MAVPLLNTTLTNKRLFRWFVEGLVLLLVLYLLHLWQTRDTIEGQAPPLSGRFMTGEAFSLEAPRDQPLLIYFWASWCPVCGLSSSSVDKLTKHHSQACRYLVKDFGTSESPKSTRQRDSRYAPT